MRVLVTGATGFFGSHVVHALLSEGHEVRIVVRASSSLARLRGVVAASDVFDVADEPARIIAASGCDVIVHAATHYGRHGATEAEVEAVNVTWPLALLAAAAAGGAGLFVNIETSLPPLLSGYARTKRLFADAARRAAEEGRIRVCGARLESVYGPGDDPEKFLPSLLHAMMRGASHIALSPGDQSRDFIYVDDAVDAFVLLLSSARAQLSRHLVAGIGRGVPVTIRELAETCKRLTGAATQLDFGALPHRPHELMRACADTTVLDALGARRGRDLETGLAQMIHAERTGATT